MCVTYFAQTNLLSRFDVDFAPYLQSLDVQSGSAPCNMTSFIRCRIVKIEVENEREPYALRPTGEGKHEHEHEHEPICLTFKQVNTWRYIASHEVANLMQSSYHLYCLPYRFSFPPSLSLVGSR